MIQSQQTPSHHPHPSNTHHLDKNEMDSATNPQEATMNSVAYYNNSGIAYLAQDNHQEALNFFKEAAQIMHTITQTYMKEHNIASEEALEISTAVSESSSQPCHECTVQQEKLRQSLERSLHEGSSFAFALPVYMEDKEITASNCTVESAAILYNMAVTYHLNSLRPSSFENAMANARALYEMVHSLAIQYPLDDRCQRIIIGATNNLGHVCHECGDFDKSRQYFDGLANFILSLESPQEQSAAEERQQILLNAIIYKNPNNAAAA